MKSAAPGGRRIVGGEVQGYHPGTAADRCVPPVKSAWMLAFELPTAFFHPERTPPVFASSPALRRTGFSHQGKDHREHRVPVEVGSIRA